MTEKDFKKKYEDILRLYCEVSDKLEKLKKHNFFKENRVPLCNYFENCIDYTTISLGSFERYIQEMNKHIKRKGEIND